MFQANLQREKGLFLKRVGFELMSGIPIADAVIYNNAQNIYFD